MTTTTQPDIFIVPLDDLPNWPKPDDPRLDYYDVLGIVVRAAVPEVEGDRGQLRLDGIHFECLLTGESGYSYRNFRGVNIFYSHPISSNRRFKRIVMKKDRTISLAAIREAWGHLRDQLKVDEALRDDLSARKDAINASWHKLHEALDPPWQVTIHTAETVGVYELQFKSLTENEVLKLVGFYKFINGLPTHEGAK